MSVPTFSAETVAGLPGPEWLAHRRRDAWEQFASGSLPTEAEEVWRYSGIDRFDLERFAPRTAPITPGVPAAVVELADRFGPRSALIVTRNGAVVGVQRAADISEGDVTVHAALSVRGSEETHRLGALAPARDAFGQLHDAFLADAVVFAVAPKVTLAEPVIVVHLVEASPPGQPATAVFPRTVVTLGDGAEASVVEVLMAEEDMAALVVPVTELDIADDATLSYANVQVLGRGCWQIATQSSRIGTRGALRSFTVGLGGSYARVRTNSELAGERGTAMLLAAYLGTDTQVHDFRTLQDHQAPRTESELLFEGAVAGTSRSVYSGLIRVRNGAKGANAFQTNHNLVLSEGAQADSVPNLDIEENDVKCSHASTVGPIDEDQRYYLESRGIEPAVAERLIVLGFFRNIALRSPITGVSRWLQDAVASRASAALDIVEENRDTGSVQ
jgi:Fe-S cluster assembly protein SufD